MNEVKYLLKGLDCANCAMKIEKQLNKLPEIETAVVDFATLKCVINYKTYSEEIEQKVIQCIIDTEDEVTVIKKNASHKHEEHHHEGECSCGHDHHDHHEHGQHHADDVFESWGIETAHVYTEAELKAILDELCENENILRAKGMVAGEEDWYYFDLVPHEAEIRKGSKDVIGKLCVIGTHIDKEAVKQLFRLV